MKAALNEQMSSNQTQRQQEALMSSRDKQYNQATIAKLLANYEQDFGQDPNLEKVLL